MIADLRSDTLTKPTAAMREAMASAEVGDDVFGEDPTVNLLESRCASLFGKEAALFVPSGTMGNQIAIAAHTQRGDEIICASISHIYLYEGGGAARHSGCSLRLIQKDDGLLDARDIADNVNSREDDHLPYTRLVSLEDTCNKGGGTCYTLEGIGGIRKLCDERGLHLHLDGARVFNALVHTGYDYKTYAQSFDSMNFCLSKGLGAPVGSMLVGSRAFIRTAHRVRKAFGGGMRQAGILAAAGIYALDHHVERLKDDHHRAQLLAEMVARLPWVVGVTQPQTNIVIFEVSAEKTARQRVDELKEQGILCFPFGPQKIRFVTHLDFHDEHLEVVSKGLKSIL
ncbi:MAG: low-specificity L-threonine aldolase [Flavobacteriales bacterium]|nr:low-specificity L-threonine aldolase [Flavobacteriales bacterium]